MNNDTCGQTPDYLNRVHKFAFFVYAVGTPIFAIFDFFGQSLLLMAVVKLFKSKQMYAYQVHCASAEAGAVVFKILFFLSLQTDPAVIGDDRTQFQDALSRTYAFVWYSARMARPMGIATCTLCLLLSTVMAADRVMALWKPIAYKNANHKVWQRISLPVCILLSFSSAAYDVKRTYVVTEDDGRYAMATDVSYSNQTFVKVLSFYKIFLQAFGLVSLAFLSVALCYLYRTRFLNLKVKISGTRAAHEEAKRNESVLFTLTLCQCLHSVLYVSCGLSSTAFVYWFPDVYACWRGLWSILTDLARMTVDVFNFFGVLFLSKKVRRVIKTTLPCVKTDDDVNRVTELRMPNNKD